VCLTPVGWGRGGSEEEAIEKGYGRMRKEAWLVDFIYYLEHMSTDVLTTCVQTGDLLAID